MKFMSSQRQAELVQAAKTAAVAVQAGSSPDDAITKVAVDDELSKNEIRLVVDAFNTSRTLANFRNKEAADRAAAFDLADFEKIAEALYPEEDAEKVAQVVGYDPLGETIPDFRTQKATHNLEALKMAHEITPGYDSDDTEKTANQLEMDQMRISRDRLKLDTYRRQASELQTQAGLYSKQADDAAEQIADHFTTPYNLHNWPTFRKEAGDLMGDIGTALADKIASIYGIDKAMVRAKVASEARVTVADPEAKPHMLLQIAKEAGDLALVFAEKSSKVARQGELAKQAWEKIAFGAGLGALINSAQDRAETTVNSFSDPIEPKIKEFDLSENVGLESNIQAARTGLAMRDLFEDEVIGEHAGYNPASVTETAEQLLASNPALINQPIALRQAVRRHLEMGGNTELHEIEQLNRIGSQQAKIAPTE